ncbi:MAG: hypothetical protein IJY35_06760, partial [Clostridia bacterium]|nr:hypothetical protein [Clostridia bacterium]
MLELCSEIHEKEYVEYSRIVSDIAEWYEMVHKEFASKLQSELQIDQEQKYQVKYEIRAKEKLLNNI